MAHSESLDSFGCVLDVVGFILGRSVHSGAPRLLFGSFKVIGFIWEGPGGRVFIREHLVHSGAPWRSLGSFGVVRFIRVRPRGPLGSYGVVGFILVRLGRRWVNSVSLGSFGCTLESLSSFRFVEFIRGCHWVHFGMHCWSLGSFWVVGFIRMHSIRFIRLRPWRRWVH